MQYIRSAVFFITMVVTAIVFAVFSVLLYPLSFQMRYRIISQWARFNVWWLGVSCGLRYEVEGLENLPKETAIVFAKHSSTWETFALQCFLPPQTWVLKRELLRIPFFGWGLAMLKPVAIDRASGRKALKQLIELGTQCLDDGRWLIIFPEGTRMPLGQQRRFGFGAAMLAEKCGHPLVPVAHNAGQFWPKHSFLKKSGVIKIKIGQVVETEGKKASQINDEAEQWMLAAMEELTGRRDQIIERSSNNKK